MADISDDLRQSLSGSVPVYVRADGDAWSLIDAASGDPLSAHDSARQALAAALEHGSVGGLLKEANLRSDGEADGAWRWLDASAEEPEAVDGARITAESMWEMAAGLNARATAIPIDGGGAPEGLSQSEVHGTARDTATPANGFAHLGVPVVDDGGTTHLYLHGELISEVAAEVDRGRLAYGSIHFRYEDTSDDGALIGAELVSHALTNDPAVTTLTPGSSRGRSARKTGCRTRRMQMAQSSRGPALDKLTEIATALNVDISEEMKDADAYWGPIMTAIQALKSGAQVEQIVGDGAPPAEAAAAAEAGAQGAREVEGLEGEEVDSTLTGFLEFARSVLDKPDATPAELLAELDAQRDPIAAALAGDGGGSDDGTPASDASLSAGQADRSAARAEVTETGLRAALAAEKKQANALRAKVVRFESERWVDAEIAKRGLAVADDRRERLIVLTAKHGKDLVEESLANISAPPSAPVMGSTRAAAGIKTGPASSVREAVATELEALRSENPELKHQQAHRAAVTRARAKHPQLFAQEATPTVAA